MPYDRNDPRATLATAAPVARGGVCTRPSYVTFDDATVHVDAPGAPTWWVRSQACLVGYARAVDGARLHGIGLDAEQALLLPEQGTVITVRAAGDPTAAEHRVEGPALVLLPAGSVDVTVERGGEVVRIIGDPDTNAPQLAARAANAARYADSADVHVAPFTPWPDPPAGARVRVYRFADVAPEPGRFGRIYRCTNLMVNVLPSDPGPRDPAKLSPHHHDDFEQLSLQLRGDYVHHIRTPWTPDMGLWHDDEHQHVPAPSLTVIPPPLVHTSQGVGEQLHWLVDIFAPPRTDFSQKPGWVLNADEYPMPDTAG